MTTVEQDRGISAGQGSQPQAYSAFISYASPDKVKAHDVVGTLEARGLRCWIAPRDLRPGQEFGEEIINGIRNSKCLVLLLSDAANQSQMVRREVERAVSLNHPVFPVRIEEVLPARSLEFFVSATHWIDAWDGRLTDHVIQLADEITDERRMAEMKGELKRRLRRRQLPRWIGGLVLLVAGLVVGALFSNRGTTIVNQAESQWLETTAREAGIDLDTLSAKDFEVSVKPGGGGLGVANVYVKAPSALDTIISRGGLEFRIGSRPWKYVAASPLTAENVGTLDPKDLEAAKPLQLRLSSRNIDGRDGPIIGPFEYDIDVRAIVHGQLGGGTTEQPLLMRMGGRWMLGQRFFGQNVTGNYRSVRVGADPGQLTTRVELPRPMSSRPTKAEIEAYIAQMTKLSVGDPLSAFTGRDSVYAQVEFGDGTRGPIVEVKSADPVR